MEHLLDYFTPEKYHLDLYIDKTARRLKGLVTIRGRAKSKTIKFHAVGLSINSVKVGGKTLENTNFEVRNGLLTLFKVPESDLVVEVGYQGSLNENMQGAYLSSYQHQGKTELVVATQFESHYAREAFPCIDEPAAKAVFELQITLPKGADDLILANTPVSEVLPPENDSSWGATTVFEPTPRMSSYLLAWVIGHFHGRSLKNAHGTKITTYAPLNQSLDTVDFANQVAARSLEFYDEHFGIPYPLPKLNQIALPDFEAGAMENWGLVTYRESMLLAGPDATLATKKSVALTVAHELSHQWFGDLVTMSWWDDLWLNESFASIMEYYAVDHIYPEFQIFENFFTGDAVSAFNRDALLGVQSVHQEVKNPAEIATLFDGAIVYAKGARLMLMLIRAMGWGEFCKGIRDYFEKFAYKNTVGDDLWAALKPYADFDPHQMMHAFIDRPGYPVLTWEGSSYTQKRFLLDAPMEKSDWPLPAITDDMSGYYLINLSDSDFQAALGRFDDLGLEQKLRLLLDRNLLARTDLVSAASLAPLAMKFRRDHSAAVWRLVSGIIGNLKIYFDPDSPEEKNFHAYIQSLITPKLEEIGIADREDSRDENLIRLRATLLSLALESKDAEVLHKLEGLYHADPEKMPAEIREFILVAALLHDPGLIDDYLHKYQTIADPDVKFDYLFAGTESDDKHVLGIMLALLDRPDIVKPQDQAFLFIYLFRNPHSRDRAFEWLEQNWETVRQREGDKSLETYPRCLAGVIRTNKNYRRWQDFFLPMKDDPALSRAIEIGEREIAARLKLIETDQTAVFEAIRALE